MAHFFKIKISVVAAGDNFPDACTEESTDLENVRNEVLLPLDVSNLVASLVCTIEDDLEHRPPTQRPVTDEAEVGTLFFTSTVCACPAATRARCWVRWL